jgi:hypothetical protein
VKKEFEKLKNKRIELNGKSYQVEKDLKEALLKKDNEKELEMT